MIFQILTHSPFPPSHTAGLLRNGVLIFGKSAPRTAPRSFRVGHNQAAHADVGKRRAIGTATGQWATDCDGEPFRFNVSLIKRNWPPRFPLVISQVVKWCLEINDV